MSGVVSNVRVGRAARWGARAALYAAVLTPLGLVALPARDLVAERARLERAASERRADRRDAAAPGASEALLHDLAQLDARVRELSSAPSDGSPSPTASVGTGRVEAATTPDARTPRSADVSNPAVAATGAASSALEARTLVALVAREQGLALQELSQAESALVLVASGPLSTWVALVDRLAELRLAPQVRSARFERVDARVFRGRVELQFGAADRAESTAALVGGADERTEGAR
ncbi:MAG: hypothetical protein IPJ77_12285 [Planctomycetes bacterium]|nr:hypothetical protein [Planctomycetota bacterium]